VGVGVGVYVCVCVQHSTLFHVTPLI